MSTADTDRDHQSGDGPDSSGPNNGGGFSGGGKGGTEGSGNGHQKDNGSNPGPATSNPSPANTPGSMAGHTNYGGSPTPNGSWGGNFGGFDPGGGWHEKTSVGAMGTDAAGYGPLAYGKPEMAITRGFFGNTSLKPTGRAITSDGSSLSIKNANNVSAAYRSFAGTFQGFGTRLAKKLGSYLGIGEIDPTLDTDQGNTAAPSLTGAPEMSFDPIAAITTALGFAGPIGTLAGTGASLLNDALGHPATINVHTQSPFSSNVMHAPGLSSPLAGRTPANSTGGYSDARDGSRLILQ